MCGIIGVVGNDKAVDILLVGLEKLEYRGYDSAGIMVATPEDITLTKVTSRVASLREQFKNKPEGTIGIGHTRWATHGKAALENAHPHISNDEQFVLVHNGVIENYLELKGKYVQEDILKGQTDSEVIVEVMSYYAKKGLTTLEAFKQTISEIKGSYALALVDLNDVNTMYIAKNKSPLLIGVGEDCHYIGSDAMAMIQETSEFIEPVDGDIILLKADELIIFNKHDEIVSRTSFIADLDTSDVEKGLYPHFMLKEIEEQPNVIRKHIDIFEASNEKAVISQPLLEAMKNSDRIYIVACGTSWHAGLIGKTLFENLVEIPVEVHIASEMGYHMPLLTKKPFFIFLSQSGETADSRQVLVQTNALGYPSLAVTNVKSSTLAREAEFSLELYAGPEIAVASTKAYTAQISVLAYLAKALGMEKELDGAKELDIRQEMSRVAVVMDSVISEKNKISNISQDYLFEASRAFFIGRGLDYAVSVEAALKLKEISYIQAEGFAAGELKHGTIALIEEGTPVIALISDPKTSSHTRGNIEEVRSRGAKVMVISNEINSQNSDTLILPNVHPLLSPLVNIVPLQLLAYYASLQRNLDVDKPRNLAKSVTVE